VTTGIVIGTIAVVLIVVVVGLLVDRKHPLLPRPADLRKDDAPKQPVIAYAAGEAPATAIRARSAQLAKLREQRCTACRAAMTNGADDSVRYNDRELIVLHFACPACDAKRSLYVEPTS
jgi:hypothetical protein